MPTWLPLANASFELSELKRTGTPTTNMLFVSDIDGTLLNADRELSARTVDAIRSVQANGHQFVLCSSRMPQSIHKIQHQYSLQPQWTLAYNGAFVTDPHGDTHIDEPISAESARSVYEHGMDLGLHISLHAGTAWHSSEADEWEARETANTRVQAGSIDAKAYITSDLVTDQQPHKIMAMGSPELIDRLATLTEGTDNLVTYRAKDTYLEIAATNTSKGSALDYLSVATDTPINQVVYFGDGHNDVSALTVAGIGVAVANAVPEAVAAANQKTASGKDDGVAAILECFATTVPAYQSNTTADLSAS